MKSLRQVFSVVHRKNLRGGSRIKNSIPPWQDSRLLLESGCRPGRAQRNSADTFGDAGLEKTLRAGANLARRLARSISHDRLVGMLFRRDRHGHRSFLLCFALGRAAASSLRRAFWGLGLSRKKLASCNLAISFRRASLKFCRATSHSSLKKLPLLQPGQYLSCLLPPREFDCPVNSDPAPVLKTERPCSQE